MTYLFSAWLSAGLLVCCLLFTGCEPNKAEVASFSLSGTFEDNFDGSHSLGGRFTIHSCGTNALIDIVFENGHREVTGTDGQTTFTYNPITPAAKTSPQNGLGSVALGRFPTNAHFFTQIIRLVCTDDPQMVTVLPSCHFSFYPVINTAEIIPPRIQRDEASPHLITSVEWYDSEKMAGGGFSPEYPKGRLLARVSVTTTQADAALKIPSKITYTQYRPRSITNTAQLAELRPRSPDDVLPVELAVFSITNFHREKPLSTYVPEVTNKWANITDLRSGRSTLIPVRHGRSWTMTDVLVNHDWSISVDRSDFGVLARDAQTLPGGIKVPPYTRICLGSYTLRLPWPLSLVLAGVLGLLLTLACALGITMHRRR